MDKWSDKNPLRDDVVLAGNFISLCTRFSQLLVFTIQLHLQTVSIIFANNGARRSISKKVETFSNFSTQTKPFYFVPHTTRLPLLSYLFTFTLSIRFTLLGAVVWLVAADRGSNCSLAVAMDGRIIRCGVISSSKDDDTTSGIGKRI